MVFISGWDFTSSNSLSLIDTKKLRKTKSSSKGNSARKGKVSRHDETVNPEILGFIANATLRQNSKNPTHKEKVSVIWKLKAGNSYGFGSTAIWIAIFKLYFEEIFDLQSFVIDQSRMTTYRFNETHGLFSGFFEPQDSKNHLHVIDESSSSNLSSLVIEDRDDGSTITTISTGQLNPYEFGELRRAAVQYFKPGLAHLKKLVLYRKVSNVLCETLITTPETQRYIERIWMSSPTWPNISRVLNYSNESSSDTGLHSIVTATHATQSEPTKRTRRSVAFHIRRGDKKFEIPPTPASHYVQKMIRDVPDPYDVEDCFVASDSFSASIELQYALDEANVTCTLSTLVQPTYKTDRQRDDFLGLLAEHQILLKATYFIGTFTSNIGDLVALTRRCGRSSEEEDEMRSIVTRYDHYAKSYGVDYDEWSMPEFFKYYG